jgi:hypothetical protein
LSTQLVLVCLLFAGDHWKYDVFISHAGTKKDLARDLEHELLGLGFTSFVDVNGLHPGDAADKKMLEAAKKAPVGLVLLNRDFVIRHWPMEELKVIVGAGTLLPVIVDMSHDQFETGWRESRIAALLQEDFFDEVRRTTSLVHERGWQGVLLQKTCLAVTRMFVEKVCAPEFPDTRRSMTHIMRVLEAAQKLKVGDRFIDLTRRELNHVEEWISKLNSLKMCDTTRCY